MPDVSSLSTAVMGMILSYQIDKGAKPSANRSDNNNDDNNSSNEK